MPRFERQALMLLPEDAACVMKHSQHGNGFYGASC